MNRYALLTPVSKKNGGNFLIVLAFLTTLLPIFSISIYDQPSADDYVYGLPGRAPALFFRLCSLPGIKWCTLI